MNLRRFKKRKQIKPVEINITPFDKLFAQSGVKIRIINPLKICTYHISRLVREGTLPKWFRNNAYITDNTTQHRLISTECGDELKYRTFKAINVSDKYIFYYNKGYIVIGKEGVRLC